MNTSIVPADSPCETQEPLVSIGVPVRNGEAFLADALELLLNQTYRNLEIVISDNQSSDGSAEIIARYVAKDARIRAHQQSRTLTAFENFRFVFEQSSGEFFMWAACDDRRSLDYVEGLLECLKRSPQASLAFGELADISSTHEWHYAGRYGYDFSTRPTDTAYDRIDRYMRINCTHLYGLIRSRALRTYDWLDIDHGPDRLLLIHLALQGDFVATNRACFYYYSPPSPKTPEQRAKENSLKKLRPFPELRLAWACAKTARRAGAMLKQDISGIRTFAIVMKIRGWHWLKPRLFNLTPEVLLQIYRRWLRPH